MVLARFAAQEDELAIGQATAIGDDESQDIAIERGHHLQISDEQADMAEAERSGSHCHHAFCLEKGSIAARTSVGSRSSAIAAVIRAAAATMMWASCALSVSAYRG